MAMADPLAMSYLPPERRPCSPDRRSLVGRTGWLV